MTNQMPPIPEEWSGLSNRGLARRSSKSEDWSYSIKGLLRVLGVLSVAGG
jgi:hypothetical protein